MPDPHDRYTLRHDQGLPVFSVMPLGAASLSPTGRLRRLFRLPHDPF
jgi:hypothetical protein